MELPQQVKLPADERQNQKNLQRRNPRNPRNLRNNQEKDKFLLTTNKQKFIRGFHYYHLFFLTFILGPLRLLLLGS
jgi:hypothetical protein